MQEYIIRQVRNLSGEEGGMPPLLLPVREPVIRNQPALALSGSAHSRRAASRSIAALSP